jgi:hypothetical protein
MVRRGPNENRTLVHMKVREKYICVISGTAEVIKLIFSDNMKVTIILN